MRNRFQFRPEWRDAAEAVSKSLGAEIVRATLRGFLNGKMLRLRGPANFCRIRNRPLSQKPTSQEVLDLYFSLPDEDKTLFLRLLGRKSQAEAAIILSGWLEPLEKERYADWVKEQFIDLTFPAVVKAARELVQETKDVPDEVFERAIAGEFNRVTAEHMNSVAETEAARLKRQRDRKPSLEIAARNVEICDLRKKEPRHWSQGRLAKKYNLDKRTIRKILGEETEWRARAARGPIS